MRSFLAGRLRVQVTESNRSFLLILNYQNLLEFNSVSSDSRTGGGRMFYENTEPIDQKVIHKPKGFIMKVKEIFVNLSYV